MRVHLIHGIHTSGLGPVAHLADFMRIRGLDVRYPDYGFILGLETRWVNSTIVGTLLPYIEPGDIIVGHSNGGALAYDLLMHDAKPSGVVFINAALERDPVIPPIVDWVDVYFNEDDTITEAANIGAHLGLTDLVWGEMGHAGYNGPDKRVTNFDCGRTPNMPQVSGHSDFFSPSNINAWGPFVTNRILIAAGSV